MKFWIVSWKRFSDSLGSSVATSGCAPMSSSSSGTRSVSSLPLGAMAFQWCHASVPPTRHPRSESARPGRSGSA